jgi:hypothetical protein
MVKGSKLPGKIAMRIGEQGEFECDILMMQSLRKAVKLQKTELYRAMK